MKMVFYGAGYFGKIALERCKQKKYKNRIIGFMDSNKIGEYCDLPILSWDELDIESVNVVITVQNPYTVNQIYHSLKRHRVKKIFWFLNLNWTDQEEDFLSAECVNASTWGECPIPQVEMHVSDCCNLNCKGCTHFSPIFEKTMPDFKKRLRDVELLKSKFSDVLQFSILGGEPFLNPDIIRYIEKIRKMLPNTYLQIVTNGLLLLELKEEIFLCMKENNIIVSISEYEPTHRKMGEIKEKLNQYKIPYIVRTYDSKQKFNKPLSLSETSKYPKCCISDGCVNIWNGKIARCPTLMYVSKFNEVFKKNLPTEGILNMEENCPSGDKLLEILKQEVPLCKHCISCDMKWSVCKKIPTWRDFAEED